MPPRPITRSILYLPIFSGSVMAGPTGVRSSCEGRLCRRVHRQAHREAGAGTGLRVHSDASAMGFDDLVGDRQAEARALADVLGGEERIEDPGQHLGGYALAVVGDF